jgi:TDG/mug DNA glycosylase family protein
MATARGVPDHIQPGLLVLFVGINPSLRSAQTGHHFAGHSNRFWKLLYESKLVPEPLTYKDDARLPEWKLGLTNIIRRSSAGIDVLKRREYLKGRRRLLATVRRYRPHVMAVLGVTIYRMLFRELGPSPVRLGWQRERFAGAKVYVLPNPSGRNAHYPYPRMLAAFQVLQDAITRNCPKQGTSPPRTQ